MCERELGCNWELGFLRVFLCTIVFPYFIVKSLQLRRRRQITEPRKYCLVRVIVFFGVCFLYLFCFSQVGILFKFPTHFSFMKRGQVRDELKAANGYEGEDGAFKLNIENNLKKKQQMVVME